MFGAPIAMPSPRQPVTSAASLVLSVMTWPQVTTSGAPRLVTRRRGRRVGRLEAQLELGQRDLRRILRLLPGDEALVAAARGRSRRWSWIDPAEVRHLAGEDRLDVRLDVELAVALARRPSWRRRRPRPGRAG